MKRIARASLASFCLAIVSLAITGALYEMIGKWRDEQRFASHIMRVLFLDYGLSPVRGDVRVARK
jgi:hypothetical protein